MTAEEYCRDKAAPTGSNLYYSTLYHDAQSRRKLHALFAFYHEICEAVCASSDPGAARATLHWWFEEVGRMFSNAARHPVTRELSGFENTGILSQQELLGCIAAMAQFLDTPESGGYHDWLERHRAASGAVWQAAGRACGCTDPDVLDALARAGCCHGAFELLRHDGAACSVELFDKLRNDIQTRLDDLQGKDAGAPLFSITLLKILEALCRKCRAAGEPITHNRISLTPIHKLWIAWRTARKFVSPGNSGSG